MRAQTSVRHSRKPRCSFMNRSFDAFINLPGFRQAWACYSVFPLFSATSTNFAISSISDVEVVRSQSRLFLTHVIQTEKPTMFFLSYRVGLSYWLKSAFRIKYPSYLKVKRHPKFESFDNGTKSVTAIPQRIEWDRNLRNLSLAPSIQYRYSFVRGHTWLTFAKWQERVSDLYSEQFNTGTHPGESIQDWFRRMERERQNIDLYSHLSNTGTHLEESIHIRSLRNEKSKKVISTLICSIHPFALAKKFMLKFCESREIRHGSLL